MATVNLYMEASQLAEATALAAGEGMAVNEWIMSKLPISPVTKLTLGDVLEKALPLAAGQRFILSDLFSNIEWGRFSIGSRLSIGRKFFEATDSGDYREFFAFDGKASGSRQARYIRLEDKNNDKT